jgi:hypothetical protein
MGCRQVEGNQLSEIARASACVLLEPPGDRRVLERLVRPRKLGIGDVTSERVTKANSRSPSIDDSRMRRISPR